MGEALPHHRNVFDQDMWWIDQNGTRWPVEQIPASTAVLLMESLRGSAFTHLVAYTRSFDQARDVAVAMGAWDDITTQPASAPWFDRAFFIELEGADELTKSMEQHLIAVDWIEQTPLYRALLSRSSETNS